MATMKGIFLYFGHLTGTLFLCQIFNIISLFMDYAEQVWHCVITQIKFQIAPFFLLADNSAPDCRQQDIG